MTARLAFRGLSPPRSRLPAAETRRFLVDGRARPNQHDNKPIARPLIDNPLAADPRGPKAFKLTPKRLSYLRSVAKRIDHRPNLAPLVGMGSSHYGRGLEAERYFARRGNRPFPRGLFPKTSS